MIRLLYFDNDDQKGIRSSISRSISHSLDRAVDIDYCDPTRGCDEGWEKAWPELQSKLTKMGSSSWDMAVIDMGLDDEHFIELPLKISEELRKTNQCGIILLFSGTLNKYLAQILDGRNSNKAKPQERMLHQMFTGSIREFVSRDDLSNKIVENLTEPPFLLRLDWKLRALPSHTLKGPDEDFVGMTTENIADELRKGSIIGVKFIEYVLDDGVSNVIDLGT